MAVVRVEPACYRFKHMHARQMAGDRHKIPMAANPMARPASIRNAERSDDPDLIRLWRQLMEIHVRIDPRFQLADTADRAFLEYAETARTRDDYRLRVAEVDGEVVAFCVCCMMPNSPVYRIRWIGYINDLCVNPKVQRRGIGRALVEDAVWWLRRNGAESIEMYVAEANQAAQKFWRSVGAASYLDRLNLDLSKFRAE